MVGLKPKRFNQKAREVPAIPAPEIRMFLFSIRIFSFDERLKLRNIFFKPG
jgi:hypothetical protein